MAAMVCGCLGPVPLCVEGGTLVSVYGVGATKARGAHACVCDVHVCCAHGRAYVHAPEE